MDTEYPWLMLGDCLDRMKEIPDGSLDMVLCDLPYGTTTCKWDVVIPFEPLWKQYWRVCKPNAAVVLFGSEPFSSALRMSALKNFKYDWIWYKNKGSGLFSKHPSKYHEVISVFMKGFTVFNPLKVETRSEEVKKSALKGYSRRRTRNSELYPWCKNIESKFSVMVHPRSVLEFKTVNQRDKARCHPTQKPVALLEYLIKSYTNEGEIVLDNTMGSGSTGVACVNTNRKFIGIEKDEKYFEIAQGRIQAAIDEKSQILFSDVS